MKMNDLDKLEEVLLTGKNEIEIDEEVRVKAEVSLRRMVEFSNEHISPDIKITGDASLANILTLLTAMKK